MLVVLARHAHSTLNVEQRINGDPTADVRLTADGREEAAALGRELAGLRLDACVHTRFPRTRETAEIALAGREVPFEIEPLLDDIDVGELEGVTIADYRAWKAAHTSADRFPAGESLDDAARRYVLAFRKLCGSGRKATLVVCHEIPIRYALNAIGGSGDLDSPIHQIPNATPFLFDEDALERAAQGIERLA